MNNRREYYSHLHAYLAKKYITDVDNIISIRVLARRNSWRKNEVLDYYVEKLKNAPTDANAQKYKKRLLFIGSLPENDFEYIVTFEFDSKDQTGSAETEPIVATSINDQNT